MQALHLMGWILTLDIQNAVFKVENIHICNGFINYIYAWESALSAKNKMTIIYHRLYEENGK